MADAPESSAYAQDIYPHLTRLRFLGSVCGMSVQSLDPTWAVQDSLNKWVLAVWMNPAKASL